MRVTNSGWILMHRAVLKHWTFTDPLSFWIWGFLLLKANHAPKSWMYRGNLYHLERGQLLTSIHDINKELKKRVSRNSIINRLNLLEKEQQIVQEKGNRGTIITICNYDTYQVIDNEQRAAEGLQKGQQKGNRRETEGLQKGPNKELKELNNDNELNTPLPPKGFENQEATNSLTLWIEYRRQLGKKLRPATIQQIIKKYDASPQEFITAVNHSIEQGYQGLFMPKENGTAPGNFKTKDQLEREDWERITAKQIEIGKKEGLL